MRSVFQFNGYIAPYPRRIYYQVGICYPMPGIFADNVLFSSCLGDIFGIEKKRGHVEELREAR